MQKTMQTSGSGHSAADESVERALGQVLRAGVILSVLITLVGVFLLLRQHGGEDGRTLIAQEATAHSIAQRMAQLRHADGAAVILLGLLVLLLTPVFRVASMIFAFLWERDWFYAVISLLVLCILVYGIIFAR
jgi:uncharacterized membrane protein